MEPLTPVYTDLCPVITEIDGNITLSVEIFVKCQT